MILALALAAVSAPLTAPASPQWTEAGGGPLGRYSTDEVDGPRTEPTEVWRAEVGELLSEPVVSGGVIYVVAKEKRAAELVALDVLTGAVIAKSKVSYKDFAAVSILEPTIVLTTGKGITVYERNGDKLRKGRSVRGSFVAPAAVIPGIAAAHDGDMLRVIDLRNGKEMLAIDAWRTKPMVQREGPGASSAAILTVRLGFNGVDPKTGKEISSYDPEWVIIRGTGLGSREPKVEMESLGVRHVSYGFQRPTQEIIGLSADDPHRYLLCNAKELSEDEPRRQYDVYRSAFSYWKISASETPVVRGDEVYTRIQDRSVITMKTGEAPKATIGVDANGADVEAYLKRNTPLVVGEKAPEGTVDGPMSCAGTVLMLGNWAVDTEVERVLWISQSIQNVGRLIPVADGAVVYHNGEGTLICAGDERVAGGLAAAMGAPLIPPTEPGTSDAVILSDGRRIEGKPVLDDDEGVVRVEVDGAEQAFPIEGVAGIEEDGGFELVTDPYGTVHAWRDLLDMELRESLSGLVELSAKRRLIQKARALLDEVEELGLEPSEKARLQELLHGKREARGGTRDVQLGALEEQEQAVRQEIHERRLSGADWLASNDLSDEASALMAEWRRTFGGGPPKELEEKLEKEVAAVVEPWVQVEFPFKDTELWLTWMAGLAPAGGRFGPLDSVRERVGEDSIWLEDSFVIRTNNIALITKSDEADTVGRCLRSGEAAVRLLDRILDNEPLGEVEPMDVRLHASRNAFLNEELDDGSMAPQWSAGFYIPAKKVSRFYVGEEATAAGVDRELHSTFAHELTHQYIEERWRAIDENKSTAMTAGFWVVEGFARFVEDQSMEMGSRSAALDDETVRSLESAAALLEADALLETKRLVSMNQLSFGALPQKTDVEITLSRNLSQLRMSKISIFYDQSGALAFFFMNRAGDEKRALFIDYLRDYYRGKTKKKGWKALGYDSAEDLDKEFRAFLATVGK